MRNTFPQGVEGLLQNLMNCNNLSVPALAISGVNPPPPKVAGPKRISCAVDLAKPHLLNIQGSDFLSIVCICFLDKKD